VGLPEGEAVSPYVPLQVPVLRDGGISYLLIAFVRAAAFGEVLDRQACPPTGWPVFSIASINWLGTAGHLGSSRSARLFG